MYFLFNALAITALNNIPVLNFVRYSVTLAPILYFFSVDGAPKIPRYFKKIGHKKAIAIFITLIFLPCLFLNKINKFLVEFNKNVLTVVLFWKIGIADLFNVLKNTNLIFLIYPISGIFLTFFLKGYRWKRILEPMGSKTSLKELIKYCFMSLPFQMITPSRTGDVVMAVVITD